MGYSSENSIRSLNVPAKTKTKIQSEKTKVLLKMQTRRKNKKRGMDGEMSALMEERNQ